MEHVELLRKLVGFRTVNNPVAGIRPARDCAEYIHSVLLNTRWDARVFESSGIFSVLGTLGEDEPTTLFLSHIDTVPAGEGWESDPFTLTVKGNRGYGRGAIDDKANIAALLLAAKELAAKRAQLKGRIVFGFTGDEEIGGAQGAGRIRAFINKEGWNLKNLIIADGLGFNIIIRRRNTAAVDISVEQDLVELRGIRNKRRFETAFFDRSTSHTAYFSPGVDRHALLMMSHFMRRFSDYTATKLEGGFIKGNVVPNWVELEYLAPNQEGKVFEGDLGLTALIRSLYPLSRIHFPALYSDYGINMLPNRFWYHEGRWNVYFDLRAMTVDKRSIHKAITEVLDEHLSDYTFKLRMGRAYINTPKDAAIVKIAQECCVAIGLNPRLVEMGGATDSRFFADLPIGIFDFGPLGDNVHGPNEYVELDSIPKAAAFYIALASKLHG